MQSNVCMIQSSGKGMQEVFEEVEKMAVYCNLPKKKALHLRLLAEELAGMLHGIVGDWKAEFWAETEHNKIMLHLTTDTLLSMQMRSDMQKVSSTGKNEAARGIMGKIKVFFEECMGNYQETTDYCMRNGNMSSQMVGFSGGYDVAGYWSLQQYRDEISEASTEKKEEWDELEKSVIANLADDIKVGIKKNKAEIIVTMNL